MKAFTQTMLFIAALTTTNLVGAAVYKHVDENGRISFSDRPAEGAEKIKLQVIQSPNKPSEEQNPEGPDGELDEELEGDAQERLANSNTQKPSADGVKYKSLNILTPKSGKVINSRSGSVQIIFLPTPSLAPSDVLVINVDGKDVSKGRDANLSLQNLQRGNHSVKGRILDANGDTKIQSDSVTFEVKS